MVLNPRTFRKFLSMAKHSLDTYGAFYAETFGFPIDDPIRRITSTDYGRSLVVAHASKRMSLGEYDG